MTYSFKLLALAAFSCCICMFCSCSNDDDPANSEGNGSFENVEATNLKASDCLNATYVKDENGFYCPQKLSPLSVSSFEAEVASHAWDVDTVCHINEQGKTELENYDGFGPSDIIFKGNGECTMFLYIDAIPMDKKVTKSYIYNASNGYFTGPSDCYILGIEIRESKRYLWLIDRQEFLICYKESTEDEILKQHPHAVEGNN